jgi:disulfide bond formation protein DsbB
MTQAGSSRPGLAHAGNPITLAAWIIAACGAAALLGAWYFQYVVGLQPCPLCLQQRIPYYIIIPAAVLIGIGAHRASSRRLLSAALLLVALVLLISAGLGVYHAGVEWKWWAGPTDCAGGASFTPGSAGDLLGRMQSTRVERCDEAPWRWLGLSLAGWNVVVSFGLAALAIAAVASSRRYGSSSLSQ